MSWPIFVMLLLFMGIILLLVEIFVVPGFGPVGIGAILLLSAGAYISWTKLNAVWALAVTVTSVVSVIASILFLKKSGMTNKLVLGRRIGELSSLESKNQTERKNKKSSLFSVGESGFTICDLRPAGIAEFQNHRLNVITDGIYIKKNTKVKIVRIEGNRIFVEKLQEKQ